MTRLFHHQNRLSMRLLAALAASAACAAMPAASLAAAPAKSHYYGRWTVSEDKPVFSSRGIAYKTIDIAPCGNDFCGVSVADGGKCGATLFRFFGHRATSEDLLHGHGRWGSARKNIQIGTWEDQDAPGGRVIELYLGDGYDFGERSENMPKFQALYRPTGRAQCTAR